MLMTPQKISFRTFWTNFNHEHSRDLKKLENSAFNTAISTGKVENDSNVIFGWEFLPCEGGMFNGFRIFMDISPDPFEWFAKFIKQNLNSLKQKMEKRKVDISQIKLVKTTKIALMTMVFDATTSDILLADEKLLQKCIKWGNEVGSQIIPAVRDFTTEFLKWVFARSSTHDGSHYGDSD
jgi:hypothetical protein